MVNYRQIPSTETPTWPIIIDPPQNLLSPRHRRAVPSPTRSYYDLLIGRRRFLGGPTVLRPPRPRCTIAGVTMEWPGGGSDGVWRPADTQYRNPSCRRINNRFPVPRAQAGASRAGPDNEPRPLPVYRVSVSVTFNPLRVRAAKMEESELRLLWLRAFAVTIIRGYSVALG
jgi:hypothetical protein